MGLCFPCPAESAPPSPSPEEKRAKLAEAAERRQKEAASRGILDIQSVEAKRKKKEQLEKQMESSGPPAGGLRSGEHTTRCMAWVYYLWTSFMGQQKPGNDFWFRTVCQVNGVC
ncbi:Svip [Phodopus roborovskii]|uniref:Svip protein n=1 Tax=Phodopus roborovskii TaxID=109678 RepID=A0AAV0AD22_PHORO|nr:Svip [Phodopus roborovskii]